MAPGSFVLIHGGGTTGRFWDRLVPLLDRPALAVDLPGRAGKPGDFATLTVGEEAASVIADVEAAGIEPPTVVVAHSSGGLVVPEVVSALGDRVQHIVLNAASIPTEGGCGIDCMQERHRESVRTALARSAEDGGALTTPGPPDDPEKFRTAYGGEPLDDASLAFVVDPVRCVPDTMHHYGQPVHWSLVGDVPVTYLTTRRDRPVPHDLQLEMIGRLPRPATVVELDTGHIPAVTDPERFAAAVLDAVGPGGHSPTGGR
jgi:pimeloyl-ACP methyl ester carboxylesterase